MPRRPHSNVAKSIDSAIAKKIRSRRIELGLTQSNLADAIGVTYQQVFKYENGSNRVSSGRLYEIVSALNIPLNYFFDTSIEIEEISTETRTLNRAFSKIQSEDNRRIVIQLAKSLSKTQEPDEPFAETPVNEAA